MQIVPRALYVRFNVDRKKEKSNAVRAESQKTEVFSTKGFCIFMEGEKFDTSSTCVYKVMLC